MPWFCLRGCSSVDRVSASEAEGRGFDPRQPRHPMGRWRVDHSIDNDRCRFGRALTSSLQLNSWELACAIFRLVRRS